MAYTTINKSSLHFNTKLYTGNSTTDTAITGVGFQPDWLWVKSRGSAESHFLQDAVRGATKNLKSESSSNEATDAQNIKSFDSDGFTLGSNDGVNDSGFNYVAWNWKAGTGAGSSNTDGSINTTSTSVNSAAGFSISTYTGYGGASTIGHGLGAVPKMIMVKKRSGSSYDESWYVYHHALGNTHALGLNSTGGSSDVNVWNDTTPTSSVFSVGNDSTNRSGNEFVAYCFAEKTGYSKFGSYTGNGSTDGPFIYTGFKPAWVMTKKTSGSGDWMIRDNRRFGYNGKWGDLYPNNTNAEGVSDSNTQSDLLSNGFKLRMSHSNHNENGGSYIYMAFGQSIVGSNNIPATAR